MNRNVVAFLAMIAASEGTARAEDPYRVCYGYKWTVKDLTWHPAERRTDNSIEWGGEKLTDDQCRKAGLPPGCVSTAAGRYQINRPTWAPLKWKLKLPDFTGPSQDAACVEIIRSLGCLDAILLGQVEAAIAVLHVKWASLPGSTAGQPITAMNDLLQAYGDAGGAFA